MRKSESGNRPGDSESENFLYELRVNQQTLEEVGVKDSGGKFFPFLDGEETSFDKEGLQRVLYIKKSDGTRIPFSDWVQELAQVEITEARWKYDIDHRILVGPDNKIYHLQELSEESLRAIALDVRSDTGHPARWPSDIAEEATKLYLAKRKHRIN